MARRHRPGVRRRGRRCRQGADRRRHRARRPGRPDVPHPLRVDRRRLRDLERRRRHRAGLRDVLGRAGGVDPRRLAARGGHRGDRRPRGDRGLRTGPAARRCAHVWRIDGGASTELDRPAGGHRRGRSRSAAPVAARRRPRHDRLHLGHHRPPQGLRAHPRQPPVRGAATSRGRSTPLFGPATARRCCSCRSRTSSRRLVQVGASRAASSSGHARRQEPHRRTGSLPADVDPRVCPASSRRSTTAPRRRPSPTARAGSSTSAADTAIAYSRALDPGGPVARAAAQAPVFDRLVYSKLRAALGGRRARTRSPAARRWASGSATSSAASASPSWRATA